MSEFNEPWKKGEEHESMCYLEDASGQAAVQIKACKLLDYPLFQSQVYRIIACVNALAGIPTAELWPVCRETDLIFRLHRLGILLTYMYRNVGLIEGTPIQTDWLPIESAPMDTWFLGWTEIECQIVCKHHVDGKVRIRDAEFNDYSGVTHWMPLPDGPELERGLQ